MSWPHILQNSQNGSLFLLLPGNFLCSVYSLNENALYLWLQTLSLPSLPLESLLENRGDDLDCAPRDVWGTPFTPILMKRYLDWSVEGGERCGRVWNSPCASKQFLILYLHLHQITQHSYWRPGLLNYTTRIKSGVHTECRDVAISPWYHEAGHWHRLDYTQGSPWWVAQAGARCLPLFSDSSVMMAIVVGSK